MPPFKDNRVKLILNPHLTRKYGEYCLHLLGEDQPVVCGKLATQQYCAICGTPTYTKHLSKKTINLYGHVISSMCYMCAALPEEAAWAFWQERLHLENLFENTDLWPS